MANILTLTLNPALDLTVRLARLATETAVSASASADILQRLADDPAVARVEEDRRMTHQSPPLEP